MEYGALAIENRIRGTDDRTITPRFDLISWENRLASQKIPQKHAKSWGKLFGKSKNPAKTYENVGKTVQPNKKVQRKRQITENGSTDGEDRDSWQANWDSAEGCSPCDAGAVLQGWPDRFHSLPSQT